LLPLPPPPRRGRRRRGRAALPHGGEPMITLPLPSLVLFALAIALAAGAACYALGYRSGLGDGPSGGDPPPPASPPSPRPPRVAHCRRQAATGLVLDAQARANCADRPLTPKERASFRNPS